MLASTLPAGTSAKGISGAVTAIRSLSGPMLVGTSLSWRPLPNLFIRWGIAYAAYNGNTPGTSTDALSYSWGVGYDDWHPGTISVTINNWGPIKFKPGNTAGVDRMPPCPSSTRPKPCAAAMRRIVCTAARL